MASEDPTTRYSRLKDAGASPRGVCTQAMNDGLPSVEAIRVLRSLFGLSFDAAREAVEDIWEPGPGRLPNLSTWEKLEGWLGQELGYCGCDHFEDAISLLRDVLRSVRDWEAALAVKDEPGLVRARLS